eukprot:CAMPEP_0194725306 /NCGR_PEP_ID=MMETSP0296-20130528/25916_1 /TAXON_ID=39354 /ORGANISM="Heterosigma akashiwo, Strain CCMP2393" /LENGTH=149 /DNA_ID=CAMNT_0039629709 /DNA_START=26 /DNA_END=475 /DNA_ORIENTATION=-
MAQHSTSGPPNIASMDRNAALQDVDLKASPEDAVYKVTNCTTYLCYCGIRGSELHLTKDNLVFKETGCFEERTNRAPWGHIQDRFQLQKTCCCGYKLHVGVQTGVNSAGNDGRSYAIDIVSPGCCGIGKESYLSTILEDLKAHAAAAAV